MDETSETESQGRNSKVDEDGSTVPAIITEEYFEEITTKCNAVSYETDIKLFKSILSHYDFIHFKLNCRRCEVC